MSSVSFKQVRAQYSLSGFFATAMEAESRVVSGNTRFSVCPNCGASSDASVKVSVRNNKWCCFSCNKKGDIIDAAAAFFGVSPAEAAKQLVGAVAFAPVRSFVPELPVVPKNQDAINRVIALLLDAQKAADPSVVKYLESKRGISAVVTDAAIFRKLLITLPSDPNAALRYLLDVVGRDLLVESGIWKKDSKCPAIVYRPLGFVSTNGRGIEFRMIAESSVAVAKAIRYGEPSVVVWAGEPDPWALVDEAMIVEGGIDMLSAVCLGSKRTIYSIPGASNWSADAEWLQLLAGDNVLLGLDNDKAGHEGADKLEVVLVGLGSMVRRYKMPKNCKDLNDVLKRKCWFNALKD